MHTAENRVSAAISVVIPSYKSANTIGLTLESLLCQSWQDWEAVVVDDGSPQDDAAVVERYAQLDGRIRLVRQENQGAGPARNTGLLHATGEWVIFLDSDDQLIPDHMEKMMAASQRNPDAGLLHCSWRRLLNGEPWGLTHDAADVIDPFAISTRTCPFAIHSAMTKRAAIMEAGAFDPALRVCEDWDLWQKLARMGEQFAPVSEMVADIHVREGSLSSNMLQMQKDSEAVILRGHGVDVRLPRTLPELAKGGSSRGHVIAIWCTAVWLAGICIGRGEDPTPVLDQVQTEVPDAMNGSVPASGLGDLVSSLAGGIAVGVFGPEPDWLQLWPQIAPGVVSLRKFLDGKSISGSFGSSLVLAFEKQLASQFPRGTTLAMSCLHLQKLDIAQSIPNLILPDVRRLKCWVFFDGEDLGDFEKLVFDGISGQKLATEIRARFGTPDLRRALARKRLLQGPFRRWKGRYLSHRSTTRLWRAWARQWVRDRRGRQCPPFERITDLLYDAALAPPILTEADTAIERIIADEEEKAARHPHRMPVPGMSTIRPQSGEIIDYGDKAYWENIYNSEDPWNYTNNYETAKYDQTAALIAGRHYPEALELACSEGLFTPQLAPLCGRILATDISSTAIGRAEAALACFPNISTAQLDFATDDIPGTYDLIVCSEVLYYYEEPGALDRLAAKFAARLNPGGTLVMAHVNMLADEPDRTGFKWGHSVGAVSIGRQFSAHPELQLSAELRTPLYRIQRFEKCAAGARIEPDILWSDTAHPLPARVAEAVAWRAEKPSEISGQWHDLPILMYHRIANDGPEGLAQWRTLPAAFEQQLSWMRDNGWQGITLSRLQETFERGRALPERSVLLTFDDATRDFMDTALPLLHRYGFPSALFVPTGKVGQTADWDQSFGEAAPLLNWEEITALRFCDVEIGAHGIMHLPLTGLPSAQLLRELAGSRAVLQRVLDTPVTALAYPFGDFDPVIRDVAETCGYRLAFSCIDGLMQQNSDSLVLPRQEVRGGISVTEFAALLGVQDKA
ncbi:glycosyltransferase [Novosphingobium album (ex Hu et al. 2023)]|uniref:Chitooligosaccharide deacetylase n=1 Tax=Novosphingobium album (ex Hu et al. 2023) TaxID=2930093 RepID=A0ABT0AZZ1_9SPHN|nr:glycosyltransferase [Novosphingobium album (ex Hu et al. 2023)]MCJ2178373.1 glycosyltransferase [Novosphingobium album (ex Hu et al. 2023)]